MKESKNGHRSWDSNPRDANHYPDHDLDSGQLNRTTYRTTPISADFWQKSDVFRPAELLTLEEMFQIIGDQLSSSDVDCLKAITSVFGSDDINNCNIKDGMSFLLSQQKVGLLDESRTSLLPHILAIIHRHDLMQFVTLQKRRTVQPDPVDMFRPKPKCRKRKHVATEEPNARRRSERIAEKRQKFFSQLLGTPSDSEESGDEAGHREKVTCDIRLRVRAEYCNHETVLNGNVSSNKENPLERQFERFEQANAILKSRDLGSIICDIKFSEVTYLDAFWRDYINGTLLEALKGVFITESLKQAVGDESIQLLVNVDEDDYESGRLKLLREKR